MPPFAAALSRSRAKIGLVCEITNGNLGNAAFEAAAIENILRYYPNAELYVSSLDSVARFTAQKVRLFPLNPDAERLARGTARGSINARGPWLDRLEKAPVLGRTIRFATRALESAGRIGESVAFWFRAARFLRGFRLLILCGGGQLSDWWGGPWVHPYTLFMWACLCRLSGTKLVVLNVAVEHVASPLSRWFLTRVLRQASYRSFRDENSRRAVEEWGVPSPNHVYPDLAFSLAIPPREADRPTASERPIVGVSPMPYCDPRFWPVKDAAAYRRYLETLASFARTLIDRGYGVMLVVTQIRMDVTALRELKELIIGDDPARARWIVEPKIANVADFLAEMPKLELLVASRMHGLLLAQLVCRPVLAISYDDKCDSLMAALGLSAFCLDIRTIDRQSLVERFEALSAARDAVAAKLEQRVAAYRRELQGQYDQVFGPD